MAEFAAAYLGVWIVFGIVVSGVVALVPSVRGYAALSIVLVAAAAWQLGPLKRRWLRECHHSVPLPPRGWRAEVGAIRFGSRNGLACLGSCWCLMLVMVVAPGAHLLWTIGLAIIITSEKLLERPRRATRLASAALGLTATAALVIALL